MSSDELCKAFFCLIQGKVLNVTESIVVTCTCEGFYNSKVCVRS